MIAGFAKLVQGSTYLKAPELTSRGLHKLREVLSVYTMNQQRHKLVYDSTWGGVITMLSLQSNDGLADYGNALYNDHHFQYGYWIYAAAVIVSLDNMWLEEKQNRAWVDTLIQDFANPVDGKYPFSRTFDWWHGHSWASGLTESADGKNEESTSEDAFGLYAILLWARVTEDKAMEARASVQLAILARSLHNYFLMEADNTNHPARFIGQKVTGIVSSSC